MESGTVRLSRLFARRFLENDLVAPAGDFGANAALCLAVLAAPGLFQLGWLLFSYGGPFLTPSERLLLALDHKYQFLACSMIFTALVTTLEWGCLSIDRRDLAILGPLPIPGRTLWRAKVLALLVLVSTVACAVSLIPAIGFPVIWLSLLPIGLARAASVVAVHAVLSMAAAGFGFSVVIAVRSLALIACGPRRFARFSVFMQFPLVLLLLTAFLLLPWYSGNLRDRLRAAPAGDLLSPPLWFVGAYDRLTVRALYSDPDLTRDATWHFWERQRLARTYALVKIPGRLPEAWVHPSPLFLHESDARSRYLGLQPVLDRLAYRALVAFPAVLLAAGILYTAAHALHGRHLGEALGGDRLRHGPLERLARPLVARLGGPTPLERAICSFTLKTLARNVHLTYVGGFAAIGVAVAIGVFAAPAAAGGVPPRPTVSLLAVQSVLIFFILAGTRAAIAVPVCLEASWIFRLTDSRNAGTVVAGVRRAFVIGVALPLLAVLAPAHALLWGARAAACHLAFGLVLATILVDILVAGYRKVPFACPQAPGRANLKAWWPAYLAGFALFTWGAAWLECEVLSARSSLAVIAAACAAALLARTAARRRTMDAGQQIIFDEGPDPAFQTLGLDASG